MRAAHGIIRHVDAASLAFLESPEARRIVAAWPIVAKAKRAIPTVEAEWSRVAGVSLAVLRIHRAALDRSKILLPDGAIDPGAAQFIAEAAKASARVSPEALIVTSGTYTEPASPTPRKPKKRGVIEWPED